MRSKTRFLRKIVYGLTEDRIKKIIEMHESRGWKKESEIKEYGYGFGCLMTFEAKHCKN
ncbi:hypothetical protein [Caldibacillus thermoamylovorans]|jgi:hypothetical protein|uniref:hypothetical protein n=1 Tax=Caldibacillus thermoamylovorans TaxID=35841 RepID=UPI002040D483|nr:hypothetical protein [Caldibacillus thermoamylovorans]MCM3053687.1 hypothetical protein [Caldibacillus thermoamylovorans]